MTRLGGGGNPAWAPIITGEPRGLESYSIVDTSRPYCEACGSFHVRGIVKPERETVLLACEACGTRTIARVNWTRDLNGERVACYRQRPRPNRACGPEGR